MINSTDRTPYFRQLAALDLGPDAQQADIDYHVTYLHSLTPVELHSYLDRLAQTGQTS